MNNRNTSSTKRLAFSGILIALVVIVLYLESVLPINKLALYALSSFFLAVVVMEFGHRSAWIFYVSSSLTAFAVLPDKIGLVPYLIFFGVYGLLKYYIEKINQIVIEYVLKLLYFNVCIGLAVVFIKEYVMNDIEVKLPWYLVIVAFEVIFVIYDYVYTRFVQYYQHSLRKLLKL